MLRLVFLVFFAFAEGTTTGSLRPGTEKRSAVPNVVIILADDLGYGDLGFLPFSSPEMMHLKTPHLEAMRRDGLTMTNFHVAAPMCSPARASILVGLFPWRLGVDFIYSQDLKRDGSEEMDHEQLPLLPNIPMAFKDAGYYTAHVGKWHLGGISKAEIAARASLAKNGSTHHPACAAPGINQYGFDEYVAMSEGHDGKVGGVYGSCAQCSMRAVTHEQGNTYSTGARYLVKNDLPLPRRQKDEILTDRQTEEAMRVISEQTALRKPFFLNLWYDAPHSPWEAIEPFFTQFSGKFPATDKPVQLQKYASMIANMDWNIGRLLAHLDELGVGKDTLVLFTSDNGPEIGAGFTGGFKGRKRLLTEGGIRVPCLWRWPNRIVAGSSTDVFAVSTDIFATVLDLVSVSLPAQHRIDGVSLLPVLLGAGRTPAKPLLAGDERVSLFYAHAPDYPKLSAAWAFGLKVVWNDYEGRKAEKLPPPIRVFDMRADGREEVDIYPLLIRSCGAGTSGLDISWTNHTLIDHEELVALAGKGLGLRARRSNNKQTLANTLSSSASVSVALRIVEHLLTRMYLFRHTGEADWRRYHQSKTHVALPSCRTRSMSSAFSTRSPGRGGTEPVERIAFNDAGALLAPAFCAPVSSWNVGCYCSGSSQCASRWTEQGAAWASGALPPPPLSPLAEKHMQSSSRTLGDYLDSTLASSRFRPVCQGHGPAFSPSLVLSPQCGEDAVALWVSHLGMPEPYALCASALTQLTSDGKKDNLSPNALVAGLFEILFGNALSEGATVAASTRQQTLALVLPRAVAGQGEDSWDSYDFSPLAHRLSRGRPNAVTSLIPVCSRGHCNGVLLAVIRGQSARVTVIGDKSTSAAVVLLSKELVGMGITPTIKSHQTSGGTCTLLQVAARIAVDLSPDLSRVRQASCSRIVQAVATWARRESEVMRNERASYLRSMSGTGGKPKPKARTYS